MADSVKVNHAFVSTKPESADNTIVSKNEWNEDLILSGGGNGTIAVRDTTSPTGAKWVQGPTAARVADTFGGGASSGVLCNTVLNSVENAYILVFIEGGCITSGGADAVVRLKRDGVEVKQWELEGVSGNIHQLGTWVFTETVGSHSYSLQITVGSGTITSSNIAMSTVHLGRF